MKLLSRNILGILASIQLLTACSFLVSPRAQEPVTRDYQVEPVTFKGGSEDVVLAGELTMPIGPGPYPAVILITGSGPQDRNETIAGHKPFLVLSDYLTRQGYAVLRYDDRGVGKSSGDFYTATADDFAEDASAAFKWLSKRKEIDLNKIGFLGHSEGGYIAPMAAKIVEPAFMIFLAGPALPLLPNVMSVQRRDIFLSQGKTAQEIKQTQSHVLEYTKILGSGKTLGEMENDLSVYLKAFNVGWIDRQIEIGFWVTPWAIWYAKGHTPFTDIKAFKGPVLALFADKDLQVSAEQNAPVMEKALGHPSSEVVVLLNLNHLFQPSETGGIDEYDKIDITLDESLLNTLSNWMNKTIKKKS